MKYDFELSLDESTSLGKIINKIKDNTSVLEFGPGNGRMTKYLSRVKGCKVSIIEFDQVLFDEVSSFAYDGLRDDIEDYQWVDYYKGKKFDYIVFADVLEHLRNPRAVLEKAKEFLSSEGKVLITFPNLAHNAVLIDLFNNKFEYSEYGILDKTHCIFFTQKSFYKLFKDIGLYIEEEDYTYSQVGQMDIDNTYDDLPTEIQYAFRQRDFGEVYQYFFCLTKKEIEPKKMIPQNSNSVFPVTLFFDYGNGHVEVDQRLVNIKTGEQLNMQFNISSDLKVLKLLPMNQQGTVEVKMKLDDKMISDVETNAIWRNENKYAFLTTKGYIRIDFRKNPGKKLEFNFNYLYLGAFEKNQRQMMIDYYIEKSNNIKNEKLIYELSHKNEKNINYIKNRYDKLMKMKGAKFLRGLNSSFTYLKATKDKFKDQVFKYSIDRIEFSSEENAIFIDGWAFNIKDGKEIDFNIIPTEGTCFSLTRQRRADVRDVYKLNSNHQIGFSIRIDNPIISKNIYLIFKYGNEKRFIRINTKNIKNKSLICRIKEDVKYIHSKGWDDYKRRKSFQKKFESYDDYDYWIYSNEQMDVNQILQDIDNFRVTPKISVVVPVYNVEEKWLRKCIDSMKAQYYTNWELCIADDCSTKEYVKPLLESLAKSDSRIKVFFRENNGHISRATNSALKIATGDYIGFMDNDDELAPNALFEVVKTINSDLSIDFIYTDEDKISTRGKRFDPFFKSSWNPILLKGHNYITHFVVVKKELIAEVGGLNPEMNGSQDYDFVLRATKKAHKIHHIPKILYHWRTVETSVALNPESKEYAYIAGKKALEQAVKREDLKATVKMTSNYGAYKIDYIYEKNPMVAIVLMGTSVSKDEIKQILEKTSYDNYEVFIPLSADYNGSFSKKVHEYDNIKEVLNKVDFEYVVLLNSSLRIKREYWLKELLNYGMQHDIGIVGGKIITENNLIYNEGVFIDDRNEQIYYINRGKNNRTIGYYFRNTLPQNVFAVTEDCLMIKSQVYSEIRGLNIDLASGLMGIDLCLQARQIGYETAWTPYCVMEETMPENKLLSKEEFLAFDHLWSLKERKDPYTNKWIKNS